MGLDKVLKDYKNDLKASDATLKELEARAAEIAAMEDPREEAHRRFEEAQSQLEGVAFERERVKGELHEATILQDPQAEPLRDRYIELSDREQELREQLGDLTWEIGRYIPDPGDIAELIARLKVFHGPDAGDVVQAIQTHAQQHSQGTQERVEAALSKLPIVDPRSRHAALMDFDKTYRENEGANIERYLADEDDKGNGEAATAVLASKLEARDRRAVIRARR